MRLLGRKPWNVGRSKVDSKQKDVEDFHEAFGLGHPDTPIMPTSISHDMRVSLIEEELYEFDDAGNELRYSQTNEAFIKAQAKIADSLTDLLYVVYGAAVTYGIDLEPMWKVVHHANMGKVGGGRREDGKILKPKGWKHPDLIPLIEQQRGN